MDNKLLRKRLYLNWNLNDEQEVGKLRSGERGLKNK